MKSNTLYGKKLEIWKKLITTDTFKKNCTGSYSQCDVYEFLIGKNLNDIDPDTMVVYDSDSDKYFIVTDVKPSYHSWELEQNFFNIFYTSQFKTERYDRLNYSETKLLWNLSYILFEDKSYEYLVDQFFNDIETWYNNRQSDLLKRYIDRVINANNKWDYIKNCKELFKFYISECNVSNGVEYALSIFNKIWDRIVIDDEWSLLFSTIFDDVVTKVGDTSLENELSIIVLSYQI